MSATPSPSRPTPAVDLPTHKPQKRKSWDILRRSLLTHQITIGGVLKGLVAAAVLVFSAGAAWAVYNARLATKADVQAEVQKLTLAHEGEHAAVSDLAMKTRVMEVSIREQERRSIRVEDKVVRVEDKIDALLLQNRINPDRVPARTR